MTDDLAQKKHRSPSYPFIGLEAAIARARTLYEEERLHPAPIGVVAGHWGFKEKSSGALQTVSALRQFGLMEDTESSTSDRRVKLTETARRLLLHVPESDEWRKLALDAATKPPLYAELFDKWGTELPSEQNVRNYLIIDRNFNESAIDGIIKNYKDTLAFSGLDSTTAPKAGSKDPVPTAVATVPAAPTPTRTPLAVSPVSAQGDIEPVRIALQGGGIGRVVFSGSIPTNDDIDTLIEVLKLQKRRFAPPPHVVIPFECRKCHAHVEILCKHSTGFGYMNIYAVDCPNCGDRTHPTLPGDIVSVGLASLSEAQ
jgi:hypothetical protein